MLSNQFQPLMEKSYSRKIVAQKLTKNEQKVQLKCAIH